jgi:protein TonB
MKKFLMAAIAVFMMSGTAVVAQDVVEVDNNATMVQEGDVVDWMVALLKNYAKKADAAETLEELEVVAEQFTNAVDEFSEKYEEEIMALATVLTEQQQIVNTEKLETAMAELEATFEKKVDELTPEPLVIDKRIAPPPPLSSSDETNVSVKEMSDSAEVEEVDISSYYTSEEYEDEQIIDVLDEQPEFPGGMQALSNFLSNNIRYPRISRDNGSQGRAFVGFTVNSDGSIQDIEIMKSTGDIYLDMEAIRLVESMPKWKPGRQNGKPVRVKFVLPVNFRLVDNDENVIDELIAMIEEYTDEINEAESVDELVKLSEQCYNEITEFLEQHEEEGQALEEQLTEEQKAAYEEKLEQVMTEFQAAATKKAEQFMENSEY